MSRLPLLVSGLVLFMPGCDQSRPQDLLTVGQHQVDILGPATSERQVELNTKLMRAIETNSEFRQFVASMPPGQPLPYDPRCGLTRAEYDEFLALSKKLATKKVGESTLSVSSKDGVVFVLKGGDALPEFTGIEIDLQEKAVRTPEGIAEDYSSVDAGEDSIFGPWKGTKWTLEKPGASTAERVRVEFAIGKLSESGRGVMYYRVKEGGRAGKTTTLKAVTFEPPARD